MSDFLIALIVVYIAAIIIQIGYCISRCENEYYFRGLSALTIIIVSIIFAPVIVLLEIGAALFLVKLN